MTQESKLNQFNMINAIYVVDLHKDQMHIYTILLIEE